MTALLYDTRILATRSVRHSLRNTEALLTAVMLPVMLMLLFVYVFGRSMNVGTDYVDYVVPGIIVLCAGFGAAGTAVSVTMDMTNGIVNRLRSMPVRPAAVLGSHVTASVARNMVATGVVLGVALAVGWRPDATPVEWLAAAGVTVGYIVAISWLAAAFGTWARTIDAANAMTFIVMFVPYVSSAFVRTDDLPSGLRWFAEHQPVTPLIETLRGLWMSTPIGNETWWAVAWCAGIAAVSIAAASCLFTRRTHE